MGKEEIGTMMKRIIYLILPALLFILSCEDKTGGNVKFSYPGIIDKEYRFNVGRVIPVTIGQSIETDGDISKDGQYFFYSSNSAGGNYDIYLRSMTDITTVRLTSHPSKEITPVISPNGKKLAFVSFRDDPDGDIFVMKINPGELIKNQSESTTKMLSPDKDAVNISIEKDKVSEVIINTKDANPVWSPDGKSIAYSSTKGGMANIWIMDSNGSDKKRITEKGGQYPSFSADGAKIVFVSYRENDNGDIYTLDVKSGKENRVIAGSNIKLYPTFMNDINRIIYSSIENDTNKNGSLDLQDRSVIRYFDSKSNLTYPLTGKSESSFKAKWLPVLTTRDYNGIIIYTDITGENINLNIIPETGIIPKKINAKLQYDMCETFLSEYDDTDKYLLSLESVYNIYNNNTDNTSKAYVNRALEEAAFYYKSSGDTAEAKRIISIIKKRAEGKDLYASFILDLLEKPVDVKRGTDIESISGRFGSEKNSIYFLPFALEDIADIFYAKNDLDSSLKILNYISEKHPDFERIMDIKTKISLSSDDLRRTGISESAIKVLTGGNANQKITIVNNLVKPFSRPGISSSEADSYLGRISGLKSKFKDDKKIMAVLSYISGLLYDIKGSADESREEMLQSITLSHQNDLTYYLSNIKLGEIERRQSRFVEAEKYFNAGVIKYSRRFKTENFKERLLWLVNYYVQSGGKSELKGAYKDSTETYEKLINIVTLMHNKRLYPEVYSEFAPKAHILYIDSYTALKGEASISDLEKSYTDKLPVFRMDFNRAAIYGLGYIYTKKALHLISPESDNESKTSSDEVYKAFKDADDQVDWALFIDDGFIEPYILKSWIYQYIDLDRKNSPEDTEKYAGKYFPKHLWEENIVILEKALNANDEKVNPENEGNIHLNMANNYFLLLNYPRALNSYKLAEKYKKTFGSDVEKALFHFHLGYSLWQNEELKAAKVEIKKAYDIYNSLSITGGTEKFKYQYLTIYRYFALFSRYENKYSDAVEWYRKILKFADENKLTIDRARYFQEIAYCFIKTGNMESARVNLNRSAVLLEEYPDDERKYYLKIKLFGILPVLSINLGPDAVVIGENRIYYPLDTQSKKLLNLSLLEEIAVAENNYTEAMKVLKDKIKVLEESATSVAVDTRIRSLNNLGYYSYVSGKLKDAETYFNQAGELAAEKMNLKGTFSSMMNLVNLYALMIEDEKNGGKEWEDKITSLIGKIDSYKKNYYDQRLIQETEALTQAAEAKKDKVTDEQIFALRTQIEQDAVSIYYSLDISSAVLKYYLAEILYASDPALADKDTSKGTGLYSINNRSFNLYKEALKNFETSIPEADKYGRKELKAKLTMNAVSCYERIGEFEKAYVSLIDAKNFAEQNSLNWIKINAYHKTGNFLYSYGKEVENSDSTSMADKSFSTAISAIEEYPALYSSYSSRVKIIYRDYINFLIDKGYEKRAFELAERYAQTARIISINNLSPEFSNEYDRRKYYDYSSGLRKLDSLRSELSALLLSGAAPADSSLTSVKKNISQQEESLKSLQKEIRNEFSSLKPYVELSGYKDPASSVDLYGFHETGKGLFYWKVSKGKMSSGYIKDNIDSVITRGTGSPVFILLSDTVIDMTNRGVLKSSTDFIFINTIDRISEFLEDTNNLTGSIHSEEKGIRGSMAAGINVDENGGKSLSGYSLIIDKAGSGIDMSPDYIFSSGISPVCIIQTGMKTDYNYLTALMESALYSGTKRIIVTPGDGGDLVLSLAKKVYGENAASAAGIYFTLGYANIFNDKKISDAKGIAENEFNLFGRFMKSADFQKAGIHLARWNSLLKGEKSPAYIKNLWLMELLSGRITESLAVLDSYTPIDANDRSAVTLRKAYTYFYSGDLKNAEKETGNISASAGVSDDVRILNSLIKLFRNGDAASADLISGLKKPFNTILPAERYIIPAAQYLYLEKDDKAKQMISSIPAQAYLSGSEHLMRNIIGGVKPPVGRSIRFDRIAALWNNKDLISQGEDAAGLIRAKDGIDSLSVFPVLQTIIKHEGKNLNNELIQFIDTINIESITAKSDNPAGILLLKRIDDFLSESEKFNERVPILKSISALSMKNSFDSIAKETALDTAMNYYLMENYQESYDTALSTEELIAPEDKSYADMQLLRMNLYIKSGKYKEAEIKGGLLSKIGNLSPERKYMLSLQLSRLELNRLSTLKKATAADAAQFEKLFSSAFNLAKHNTELLNRRGYKEITGDIFDEFVNYKMKTGQHSDAHYYNEIKKLLIASSKCGSNLFKFAGTIDMAAIQQILPDNGIYVNIAKNKNDLFVWTADKKSKKAFVIENVYPSFEKFLTDYIKASAADKDLTGVSRETAKVLSPLYTLMKDKKVILISTDSATERIPFEIAGEKEMLSDKALLLYIPSLLIASAGDSSIKREVYLPESDDSTASHLAGVAVRESGIKYSTKSESAGGMVHLTSMIKYNQFAREFTLNERNLKENRGNSALLSASSDALNGTGSSDFLLYAREFNLQAALLNGSVIQDTNNALFIEEFYRNAGRGLSLHESFAAAVNRVKGTNRYSHPANWSGYRLNIYNLNLMKGN